MVEMVSHVLKRPGSSENAGWYQLVTDSAQVHNGYGITDIDGYNIDFGMHYIPHGVEVSLPLGAVLVMHMPPVVFGGDRITPGMYRWCYVAEPPLEWAYTIYTDDNYHVLKRDVALASMVSQVVMNGHDPDDVISVTPELAQFGGAYSIAVNAMYRAGLRDRKDGDLPGSRVRTHIWVDTYDGVGLIPVESVLYWDGYHLVMEGTEYYLGQPVHPLTVSVRSSSEHLMQTGIRWRLRGVESNGIMLEEIV